MRLFAYLAYGRALGGGPAQRFKGKFGSVRSAGDNNARAIIGMSVFIAHSPNEVKVW